MTSPTAAASMPLDATSATSAAPVLTPSQLLAHWQGHRRVTRRVIEAFPDETLFTHSVGGMRPFAELAAEIIGMAVPVVQGVATGEWAFDRVATPATRAALLERWDATTADLDRAWATLTPDRFQVVDSAFGMWEGPGYQTIAYAIDNEIHHRAQGYVYLRSLGIEPPPFYERG